MSQEEDLQRAYRKALAEYEQARLVLKNARDDLAALHHKELKEKDRLKMEKRRARSTAIYQERLGGKTYAAIGRKYGIAAQRVSWMVHLEKARAAAALGDLDVQARANALLERLNECHR